MEDGISTKCGLRLPVALFTSLIALHSMLCPSALRSQDPTELATLEDPSNPSRSTASATELDYYATRLGNSDFQVREETAIALLQKGDQALPILRGLTDHSDLEVRTRARSLLQTIERGIKNGILRKFLRDSNPENDYGMKGWKYFSSKLGSSRKSKSLFIEFHGQYPKLAAVLETSPEKALLEAEITAAQVSDNFRNNREPSVADGVAIFAALYEPSVQQSAPVHDSARLVGQLGGFKQLLLDPQNAVARKMFGNWLTVVNDAAASRALLTAREVYVPESPVLARRVLNGNCDLNDFIIAVDILMRNPSISDAPCFEKYMDDEEEIDRFPAQFLVEQNLAPGEQPRNTIPNAEVIVQRRDIALLCLLIVGDAKPEQYFKFYGKRSRNRIDITDAAIVENVDETRKQIKEAWLKAKETLESSIGR